MTVILHVVDKVKLLIFKIRRLPHFEHILLTQQLTKTSTFSFCILLFFLCILIISYASMDALIKNTYASLKIVLNLKLWIVKKSQKSIFGFEY